MDRGQFVYLPPCIQTLPALPQGRKQNTVSHNGSRSEGAGKEKDILKSRSSLLASAQAPT